MYKCSMSVVLLLLSLEVTFADGELSSIRVHKGHNLLQEKLVGNQAQPGDQIPPLRFRDLNGQAHFVNTEDNVRAFVILVMSTKCPLAKRYATRLNRLSERYNGHQVRFVAIFPNDDETSDGIREYADAAKLRFPVVRDFGAFLASSLGATMTPQAFVLDGGCVLRYRGAIDDNRYEARVKNTFLADAVFDVVAGESVRRPTTKALGCTIHTGIESAKSDVTYAGHIARILQDNCQACHRPGQVAPFSLTSYDEAYRWRKEIAMYTGSRLMPPWKAVPGVAEYLNDISLSTAEINLIDRWVNSGASAGDETQIPPRPKFDDGWAYGEPDLVIEMPEEYVIGPEGEDDLRHFVIPHEAIRDRFVEAIDVRPGNRSVVHHVLGYVDTSGNARKLDAADDGPGYTRFGDVGFKPASLVGGWAPGNRPTKTLPGTGRWLPKKCDVVLQVHYYRTGIEERDRTKIGLYFSKAETPVPTRVALVQNKNFEVPAHNACYTVEATHIIKEDSLVYAVAPHMHLIGESIGVNAELPNGDVIDLVQIDDWDFNWQLSYFLKEPVLLPAGTNIRITATYNNSASNPNNPNSVPQAIGWGEKTTDEMCLAFVGFLRASEYDAHTMSRRKNNELSVKVPRHN